MIHVPKSVQFEEVPAEKRYRTATLALSARIGSLYERALEEFGEEALELIRSVNREHAPDLARDLCPGKTESDAQDAALCLAHLLDLIGMEGEVTEISPDLARIRIEQCPFGNLRPEVCDARTALESGFVKALEKNLTLTVEACAARGDQACRLKIERSR